MEIKVGALSKLANRVFKNRVKSLGDDLVFDADFAGSEETYRKYLRKIKTDDGLWELLRKRYLEKGANIDAHGSTGGTALTVLARKNRAGVVRKMIEAGANIDIKEGSQDFTPLMHAALEGHYDTLKVLIEAGADIHAVTKEHKSTAATMLIGRVEYTCKDNPQRGRDCLQLLLDHGAALGLREEKLIFDQAPSLLAIVPEVQQARMIADATMNDDLAALNRVLSQGISPDAGAAFAEQPLQRAILRKDGDALIDALLDAGADINLRSADTGMTPLQAAVKAGNRKAVTKLLYLGADAEAPRTDGSPANLLELARLGNNEGMEEFTRQMLAGRAENPFLAKADEKKAETPAGRALRLRLKAKTALVRHAVLSG